MSQYDFPTLDSSAHTGDDLCTFINNWEPALLSQHRGASRPAYAVPGMLWVDSSATPAEVLKWFDGTQDHSIGNYNSSTGSFTLTGGATIGPSNSSSTDNAIVRWDGTTGRLIQNSNVTIDDSGNVIGVTAPQFDNTTKLATTAWVNRRGFEYAGYLWDVPGGTLDVSHFGKVIGVSSTTVTLPNIATSGARAGSSISFFCTNYATINTSGGDIIRIYTGTTSGDVSAINVVPGDTLTITSLLTGTWVITDGSWLARNYLAAATPATDNAIARFDGTSGKLQNSLVTVDDTGQITTPSWLVSRSGISSQILATDQWAQTLTMNGVGGIGLLAEPGSGNIFISQLNSAGGSEKAFARFIRNGSSTLYDNGSERIVTNTVGLVLYGANLNELFSITHNPTQNLMTALNPAGGYEVINNGADNILFRKTDGVGTYQSTFMVMHKSDGSVELRQSDAPKFTTTSYGTYTWGKAYSSQTLAGDITVSNEFATKAYVDNAAGSAGGSNATNGYRYLPGGTLLQWGNVAVPSTGEVTAYFPIAFSQLFSVVATSGLMGGYDALVSIVNQTSTFVFLRGSVPTIGKNTTNFRWVAIGI